MEKFFERNKNFLAIIAGAVIIGLFVYLGIKDRDNSFVTEGFVVSQPLAKNITQDKPGPACMAYENSFVTKVIDGDTVVVEGGYHVRLLGMDADEKGYPCYDQAKNRIEELILGKMVRLEKDKTDVDQYGRCLRYIFLGDTNIDVQLVKEGLAVARFYEPDVKYKAEIAAAEKQAQTGGIGCKWAR